MDAKLAPRSQQRKLMKPVLFCNNLSPTTPPATPAAGLITAAQLPISNVQTKRAPRMTSLVVDSVFDACKKIDPGAQLASATFTQDGETLVRVRTGLTCSINSLKNAIATTMPLCGTEVVDSPLDGTTEIGIIVPSQPNELKAARNLVRKKLVPKLVGRVGFLCFMFGLCAWLVSLVESLSASDMREL